MLAGVLGWVLFKPIRQALDAERQRHEREDQESKQLRAEAEAAAENARRAKQAAEQDIEQHREAILSRAKTEATQVLEDARERQRTQHQLLEQELEATRNAEAAELTTVVGTMAADTVRKLLEVLPGPSIDIALVRAACQELEGIPAEARQSAQVESSRALEDEAQKLLEAALGTKPNIRIVKELGAGVRVTTPAGQIDATALSFARHAAQALTQPGPEDATPRPELSHG